MDPQPPGTDAPEAGPTATPPTAPAVVAVVVARDPGPWFEEVMAAIAAQDYPNLPILVIDAASAEPVKPRVARSSPGAFVRRLDEDPGFGSAANEVLEMVEGAAFYLFCHDDIAPDPDAVRRLVEEAYRSNAAVVGPKLVTWDDPEQLVQVGQGMDHAGYGVPLVERGELDQAQHDAVRDVFTVPGPCMLVRADLFATVGGFDEGIRDFLDDVSLCWRAHIAGGRVIVAPDARVRSRDALVTSHTYDERRRAQARHRLRLVLSCYGPLALLLVIPQTIVLQAAEVVYGLIAGRTKRVGDVFSAWVWNLRRVPELREARRLVRSFRRIPDREVRHSMQRGSARFNQFLRGQIGRGENRFSGLARGAGGVADEMRSGNLRAAATVWAIVAFVLVAGSRHLLTRGIPAVSEMVAFDSSPLDLLRGWVSGWHTAGLGAPTPNPTAFGVLGGLGVASLGFMGFLRAVLTLGMLPIGALAAYRLPAPTGSRWAQIAALIVYVTVPLPYNAVANGRWSALVLYAATPVLLGALMRASRLAPFDHLRGRRRPSVLVEVLAVCLITALVAAVVPVAPLMVVGIAVALAAGGLVAVSPRGGLRMLGVGVGGAALAVVLHLPWSIDFMLPGSTAAALVGPPRAPQPSDLPALLRFEVGPHGAAPLSWSLLVAAALPLLIGRAERHAWAVRAWTVALASFGAAWASQRGSLPIPLPPVEVLLTPAAAALAFAVAMGVWAFEVDLPGYRFGWRQLASSLAGAAVVVGVLPVLGASIDGRWDMPAGDISRSLAFIDDENDDTPFRVLWLGDPVAIPLAGWELEEGVAYATTEEGMPRVEDLWVGSDDGHTGLLRDAVELALSGQTSRLGQLLAPMGVRYVVVVERLAPAPWSTQSLPVPSDLDATLGAQLDLLPSTAPDGLTVYRNEAYSPTRAALADGVELPTSGGITAALDVDLSGSEAVLPDADGHLRWTGELDARTVLHAAGASDRWELEVDGEPVARTKVFGWANAFEPTGGGDATLRYRNEPLRYVVLLVEVLAWLWVVRTVLRARLGLGGPDAGARS